MEAMNAGAARGHYGKPKLVNPERAMESTRNREAEILTADDTDKPGSGTFQMRALRAATTKSRNSETQKGPLDEEMFAYVRLCSPMFALAGKKC